MYEQISINFLDKSVKLKVKTTNSFTKFIGLICRTRFCDNLIFKFKKDTRISIHSFFVFFPFLAIWLDSKKKVLDMKIVKPFSLNIRPRKKFRTIVEIPINDRNKKIISVLFNSPY